jgi:hypothetical protein
VFLLVGTATLLILVATLARSVREGREIGPMAVGIGGALLGIGLFLLGSTYLFQGQVLEGVMTMVLGGAFCLFLLGTAVVSKRRVFLGAASLIGGIAYMASGVEFLRLGAVLPGMAFVLGGLSILALGLTEWLGAGHGWRGKVSPTSVIQWLLGKPGDDSSAVTSNGEGELPLNVDEPREERNRRPDGSIGGSSGRDLE